MTMIGKPVTPRQRAYFLLGYRRGKKNRRRSEQLRELEELLDSEEVGSAEADEAEMLDRD